MLDWELSTLGHPIADLAYSAMPYHLPWSKDGTGLQALPKELPEGLLCIFINIKGLKCLALIASKVSCGQQSCNVLYLDSLRECKSLHTGRSVSPGRSSRGIKQNKNHIRDGEGNLSETCKLCSKFLSISPGVLSEEEYIREYCQARGMALPDPDTYSFCLALSLFRMAAILAGVGARALAGKRLL